MDRWVVCRIILAALDSIAFLEAEDRANRAIRVGKQIGVSKATLYNWMNVTRTQTPDIIKIMRILCLATPQVRAWALTEMGKPLGIDADITIEGKHVMNPTMPIDWTRTDNGK